MNVASLVASQLTALALGASLVATLVWRRAGYRPVSIGYGFVLGTVGVTLILRALSFVGVKWSFAVVTATALSVAALIYFLGRRYRSAAPVADRAEASEHQGAVFWCLAALIALHWGLAQYEAWLRPLFPWDATTQWASKARLWYELRGIVPLVDESVWIRSTGVYTDAHPTYPATVPLMQAWAALAYGAWDDAVVNVGWPLTLLALAFGVHGQLRRLGLSATAGAVGAFTVVSLPFVGVHAALAGYADLTLSALYAFGVLSLAVWTRERRPADAVLLALCALALPMVKAPGWAWLATLIVGVVSLYLPRKVLIAAAAVALLAAFGVLITAARLDISIMGYSIQAFSPSAVAALLDNLFIADSWHLLGIAVPLALLFAGRHVSDRRHLPVGLALVAGATFLVVVLFFSSTSDEGVAGAITVNRALLHWIPALTAYLAWIVGESLARAPEPVLAASASDSPAVATPR